jgi:serine/threonine protein kinase/Tfp pilus assembly protein PilF
MASSDPQDDSKRIGDFEIVRELGRGGMGVVYEARQRSLNRQVALKVLSTGLGLTTKAVMRFKREAEAAAKLHHTNIVPIYSTGDENGVPYYAMELVDGPSLDQVIRQLHNGSASAPNGSLDSTDDASDEQQNVVPNWIADTIGYEMPKPDGTASVSNSDSGSTSSIGSGSTFYDNAARMISDVADALAHAHDQGVIHRDIKPSNLLLSRDGRLSINDFGLARMLEQPGMTMTGEFMGSPAYMSPEQITAGRIPLDHRTDIYSLGTTLYELLTLQRPFAGQQRDQVLSQIIHKDPSPPRAINERVPKDLETICLKAMEKDPDRRYQTAEQMAKDLRCFVNRHAISARRIGPVERCVRWVKRHRALAVAIACAVALGIVALLVAIRAHQTQQQNIDAMRNMERAKAMDSALMAAMSGDTDAALARIHDAEILDAPVAWQHMLLGQVDLFEGKPKEALRRFEAAVKLDPENVMAQSMLAHGYLANGRWNDYANMVPVIGNLQKDVEKPTPEELLFMSLVFRFADSEKALRMLDDAIEARSPFLLAQIERAGMWAHHAMDRGDVEHAIRALDELNALAIVHPDLRDNPLLRESRLTSRLALASLYWSQGNSEEARKYLREAEPDVKSLENFPGFLLGNASRIHYYGIKWDLDQLDSDLDAMGQVMQVAAQNDATGWIVDYYWTTFFRKGGVRIQQALRLLEQMSDQDDHVAWARIVLLMEIGEREEAVRIFQKMEGRHSKDSWSHFDVSSRFFMPGLLEDKVEYASIRAQRVAKTRDARQYLAGGITEDELISRTGESERRKLEVYFAAGMRQLAEGRRSDAKESFQRCVDSPVYGWSPRLWAHAFLDRLNKDENWPKWLPAEPGRVEAK